MANQRSNSVLIRRLGAGGIGLALVLAGCASGDDEESSLGSTASEAAVGPSEDAGSAEPGSDESSSAGEPDSSGDLLEAARERVAPFTERPTEPEVTEPITSDIPTGKRLTFLTCSSPGCAAIAEAFQDAASMLEWEVKVLTVEPSAEAIQAAYNTAIRDEPDGVAVAAVSSDPVQTQLATLEDMGIPVVTVQDPDVKFGPIIATLYTQSSSLKLGELTADYLISKGCADGRTIYVQLGGYLVLDFRLEGFESQMASVAPSLAYDVLDMPASEPDPSVPIVGAARAAGDVECVYLSSDHMTTGLPQAFQSAGLEVPKIITDFGGATTLQYIRDGLVTGTNVGDNGSYGFIYMDAFARHFTGQSLEPTEEAFQSVWFVDETNVPDDVPYSHVEDLQAKYAKVWGIE